MNKKIAAAFAASLLAAGIAAAEEPGAPRALTAADLQKLYGERAVVMTTTGPRHLRYEVAPDGRMIGHNLDLIGGAAVASGTSDGKWRVDAAANKVCHDWTNGRWQSACFVVVQTGPDSYEWSLGGAPGGMKFTVAPK
ncbi:MAG TPA: hypothetical protein VF816_01855 [Rhodocyclaceae bacterium]